MRATLFLNPAAGGDDDHSLAAVTQRLRDAGIAVEAFTMAAELPDRIDPQGDVVIVGGGDGTVGKVVTRLDPGAARLVVLPLGTANNLARTLDTWVSPEHFASEWRTAVSRRLDLALAEGPWGCRRYVEAIGFGAFARAVEDADRRGVEGVGKGREVFGQVLRQAEPVVVDLTVDGVARRVETLLVEVMNIPIFGPNLRLAPLADGGDGRLHAVVLRPERREAMLAWLDAPDEADSPAEAYPGRHITITWAGGAIRLDDTNLPQEHPMTVRLGIEPRPFEVLVPPVPSFSRRPAGA